MEIIVIAAAAHTEGGVSLEGLLSRREIEVMRLLARGLSGKEIAALLDVTEKTAYSHYEHIKDKLELDTVMQVRCVAAALYLSVEPAKGGLK